MFTYTPNTCTTNTYTPNTYTPNTYTTSPSPTLLKKSWLFRNLSPVISEL